MKFHKIFYVWILIVIGINDPFEVSSQNEPVLQTVAWSVDNSMLAIGYRDGSIAIIDVSTGDQISSWVAYSSIAVTALAWKPDNTMLASGSNLGQVAIWDTSNWSQVVRLNDFPHNDTSVRLLSWNHDGNLLWGLTLDGVIIWNSSRSYSPSPIDPNITTPRFVGWNVDHSVGSMVGVGGFFVIDPSTLNILDAVIENNITVIKPDPSGNFFVTGTIEGVVKLWDSQLLRPIATLQDVVISYEGQQSDRVIRDAIIHDVTFNADGTEISAVRGDGVLLVWNANNFDLLAQIDISNSEILIADFSLDGSQLAFQAKGAELEIIPNNILSITTTSEADTSCE